MLNATRRIPAIATLTVTAALSITTVAGARPPHGGHATAVSQAAAAHYLGSRVHSNLVGAGATGDGPDDDATCQSGADGINELLNEANSVWAADGASDTWRDLMSTVYVMQDNVMNEGCFLINPA